ncbi:tetratricopeptide repeat-containing sulfotransferase family protein [Devosia sp.]|uniref:tetratricopeptide repeat-containing sulfotransferase family protein n=1 Tax=Devosia sp. TaxID=1871048 RepID=UPI001AC3805F|nr:tetratricopeptide repeat-containing sulfotransferase family protein [Devosia sp.]MBN9310447.1 sulfotransferase [Devosia sp.]
MNRPAARPTVADALAHLRRGETVLGAAMLETLLRQNPRDAQAMGLAGAVALQRGDRGRAIELLSRTLALAPDDVSSHSNLAVAYLNEGRGDDARRHLQRALELKPDAPEALVNLANLLQREGDAAGAEPLYRRVTALRPAMADAHAGLALALEKLGRPREALVAAEEAVRLQRNLAEAHRTIGLVQDALGDFAAAVTALERAIALQPGNAWLHADLGNTLAAFGKREPAIAHYRKALALAPGNAAFERLLGRLDAESGALAEKVSRFEATATSDDQRMHLGFALGKAFEDAGDYPRAFHYLDAANRLRRASYSYDRADSEAAFVEIEATFTPELLAARAGHGVPDPTPIFVLGMPRSGTTLVEQILASHPDVTGAGELPLLRDLVISSTTRRPIHYPQLLADLGDAGLARLGRDYLNRLRAYAPEARFITDKMPGNFMLIGFIALCLPEARIIHCVRDPADTAVSIWRNYFSSHLGYAYDLGDIGHYHRLYQKLMAHWRRVLPGRMHDISYEQLVEDQEGETRRLLAHCGLDFRAECLDFHRTERPVHTASAVQVRSPISRSSIGIAARYGELLAPLHAELDRG